MRESVLDVRAGGRSPPRLFESRGRDKLRMSVRIKSGMGRKDKERKLFFWKRDPKQDAISGDVML